MNICFDFTRLYNEFRVGTEAQIIFPASRFIIKAAGSLFKLKSDWLSFTVELDIKPWLVNFLFILPQCGHTVFLIFGRYANFTFTL